MSVSVYTKIEIACEYLDLAMNLFLNKRDMFCAIHLAAAAEELLGQHLPEDLNSHTRLWKAHKALEFLEGRGEIKNAEAINFINSTKNAVKHMTRTNGEVDDSQITIDPLDEAEWLIERALSNFYKLGLRKSNTLWKYEEDRAQVLQQHGSIASLT